MKYYLPTFFDVVVNLPSHVCVCCRCYIYTLVDNKVIYDMYFMRLSATPFSLCLFISMCVFVLAVSCNFRISICGI